MQPEQDCVRLINITRSFPGVVAVDDVCLELHGGQVYGLVGSNGAGKSTLINILSGLLKPDSGNIQIDGKDVEFHSPRVAQNFGIVTVHQEGEFFSTLSIAENMALATEYPVNRCGLIQFRRMNQQAEKHFCLAQWTDPPQPHDSASVMSIAQRQMLQTAAAIASRPRILVLDEPTSALSQSECDWLFGQIERLKQRGTAILYVSHRLDEVRRIADHVMVMRDGRHVWTRPAADLSRDAMVRGIAGDQPESPTAPSRQQGQPKVAMANSDSPVLVVDGLSDSVHEERAVSLSIQPGEIVGVYGLIGSGRTEFAQTLFGIRKRKRGRVYLNGQEVSIRSPREAVKAGIAYVPEDRLCEGVFSGRSVRANGVIATLGKWSIAGIVRRSQEDLTADQIVSDFDIRCRSTSQTMGTLSGGNQQKVVLGRWLLTAPKVLILDEPTRGVDVRAREEIHSSIKHLTEQGTAVLLISSELSEVTDYCDRVVVFRGGSNVAEFDPRVTSTEQIADAAFPTSESNEDESRPPQVATHPLAKRLSQLRSRSASGDMVLALCVLALIVLLEASSSGFSLLSLASAASVWTLLSLAAMCVILVGGIDISIGSVLALAAVVAAILLKQPWPTWVSIPVAVSAAIATGTAAGLFNAWIALTGRVHPIVVTLGTMTIYRGVVVLMLGRNAMTGLPREFGFLAMHSGSGFRFGVLLAGLIAFACYVWLTHTPHGRQLYAVGSNSVAARMMGISKRRTWLIAFGVSGALAGMAGVLQLATSMQMQGRLGQGWELVAIAAAVIGGVSISGGRGTVIGVVLGATLLRLTNSVLVHWGIPDDRVDLMVGGLILLAVVLDLCWKGRRQ